MLILKVASNDKNLCDFYKTKRHILRITYLMKTLIAMEIILNCL